ncbi:MAG TPA: type III PLP-dependent enzyme [Phycicoccus sp.]|nr:type III PLP-dependent enzyme [Phycicoccus sp.]
MSIITEEIQGPHPEPWAPLVTPSDRRHHLPSPRLELDVSIAVERFRRLSAVLPGARIRYAVKANPHPALLRALAAEGCGFDVASPAEAGAAMSARVPTDHLIHSNPVARRDHLRLCGALGVKRFVVDSLAELEKLADAVPGAEVLIRIGTSGKGSDWPLSRKFGVPAPDAVPLLVAAVGLDLVPAGVAFHVGSQQRDPNAWTVPIAAAGEVFAALARYGFPLTVLDLGGGFPADHVGGVPALGAYGRVIDEALTATFGGRRPEILLEPGRGIVGDAGTLISRVIGIVHRGGRRWVHLDAGVFTGLVETLDEAIRYRLETDRPGPLGPCVLAGPTCDSADVLYEKVPAQLPIDLAEGDEVRFLSAGAYTSCYSTVGFNGFEPLPTVLVR